MSPEEYAKQHQKAFRKAFDFLTSHFPPDEDDEWWLRTAREVADANVAAGGGTLVTELLTGVMNYLGDEYRRRYQSGKTDN